MENLLEINLSYIRKYNPALEDRIRKHTELSGHFELDESQSGSPLLIKEGISIHDKMDPEQEAIDIFHKTKTASKYSIAVIYGIGLGYLPQRFSKSAKSKIIIFEPDLDVLRVTLELVNLSSLLSKENVMIANTAKEFEKAYEKLFFVDYDMNLHVLNYYRHNEAEALNEFVEMACNVHNVYQSNYRNLANNAVLWTESALKSVYHSSAHHPLSILKDKFNGKTAVIISAGPSLGKNIDLIKDYRDKITVFCVGTALKTALEHEIKPDFLVQIDACTNAYKQVEGFDLSDINLILEPTTYIDIHKLKTKNKFYYWPYNDNTSGWLARMWDIDPTLCQNMGTVSLTSILSAKLLGFEKIILIGQDLAYTDGKCYATGSVYDHFECTINTKDTMSSVITTSKPNMNNIMLNSINSKGKKVVPVKGQLEKIVYAPLDYALFIIYFENLAKELPENIKIINATEGGAYLNGYDHIPFKEALTKCTDLPYNTDEIIASARDINPKTVKKRRETIYPVLKELDLISNKIYNRIKEPKNSLNILTANHPFIMVYPFLYKDIDYSSTEENQTVQKIYDIVKPSYDYISKLAEQNYTYANVMVVQQKGVIDALTLFDKNDPDSFNYLTKNMYEYFNSAVFATEQIKKATAISLEELKS
jgi:hypothetical protein